MNRDSAIEIAASYIDSNAMGLTVESAVRERDYWRVQFISSAAVSGGVPLWPPPVLVFDDGSVSYYRPM